MAEQSVQQAAAAAEASLLMQNENAYLKQRAVHLNVRVRELTTEVERLTALLPDEPAEEPTPDPEPGSE